MKKESLYPYTQNNLLETPTHYHYAPFHGKEFISAWKDQREQLKKQTTPPLHDQKPQRDQPVDSILEQIIKELTHSPSTETYEKLNQLVKRFEVTKKLYGEYTINWKPVHPDDYANPSRYLRFAETLDIAYQTSEALPYLNCLLKVMDTLSSIIDQLTDHEHERLIILVAREQHHINLLCYRLEIDHHDTQ